MNQTQQSIPSPIPNVVLAVSRPIPPKFPDDTLLRDFKGEVLIVQYGKISEVFDLNLEKQSASNAARFISAAQNKATYLVGGLTSGGGRFRSITREEAIGKIGKRIFEVI